MTKNPFKVSIEKFCKNREHLKYFLKIAQKLFFPKKNKLLSKYQKNLITT